MYLLSEYKLGGPLSEGCLLQEAHDYCDTKDICQFQSLIPRLLYSHGSFLFQSL